MGWVADRERCTLDVVFANLKEAVKASVDEANSVLCKDGPLRFSYGPGNNHSTCLVVTGSPRSLSDSRFGEGERQRLLTIEDESIKNNL